MKHRNGAADQHTKVRPITRDPESLPVLS